MTRIYLVRHGVTSHTGHKLTGWMEGVHLTPEGERQAERAADALADRPIKAIYSSPIDRTMDTARIIAARHDLEIKVSRGVGEVAYGRWTNRTMRSLRSTKLWEQLMRWPSSVRFPEGETLREVQARAVGEVERLRLAHRRDEIVVVSHADTIRGVIAHYIGLHIDLMQRLFVGPASISTLEFAADIPQLISLNALPTPRPEQR